MLILISLGFLIIDNVELLLMQFVMLKNLQTFFLLNHKISLFYHKFEQRRFPKSVENELVTSGTNS